jgi:5-methylcytosine-specific restriction endonuclease McrA
MPESRGRQYRKTWRWIQLSQRMRTVLPPVCTFEDCRNPNGRIIDLTLPHNHRWAWTLDHLVELQDGGDPYDPANLCVKCRACNSTKGRRNQVRLQQEGFRQRARARELNPSRTW